MARYLTVEDYKAMTTFPDVASANVAHLELDVTRAHILIRELGTLPDAASLGAEARVEFLADMRLAHFLCAERVTLSKTSTGMAAAGITFERSGRREVSRASTTDRSGQVIQNDILTDEIKAIIAHWVGGVGEEFIVSRETVFPQSTGVRSGDPGERVVLEDDLYGLTPDPDVTAARLGF